MSCSIYQIFRGQLPEMFVCGVPYYQTELMVLDYFGQDTFENVEAVKKDASFIKDNMNLIFPKSAEIKVACIGLSLLFTIRLWRDYFYIVSGTKIEDWEKVEYDCEYTPLIDGSAIILHGGIFKTSHALFHRAY